MKVEILVKGPYREYGISHGLDAQDLEKGVVVEFPEKYAQYLIDQGLATVPTASPVPAIVAEDVAESPVPAIVAEDVAESPVVAEDESKATTARPRSKK